MAGFHIRFIDNFMAPFFYVPPCRQVM